ncbi:MAG: flavodoxin family protein [Firmicutes bacterium]|nr:flavodoxin family protein [Bacillota bacterium]MBQ6536846.1 flavodoxin family protein [Bacillota bacterium]MBQ6606363.1 flavodoxin family protein [Bacillota bacterium]MBR0376068.1 flavodoxin family protein [Bacillota bacterium]
MSQRILLLEGTYWADGNSRDLAQNFIEAAEAAGKTVVSPHLDTMNINECLSCNQCRNGLDGCYINDDDMDVIFEELKKCDALVIITPLMYFGMPGLIKTVIDRMYCLGPDYPKLRFAEVYTSKRAGNLAFLPAIAFHDLFAQHMGWDDWGVFTEGELTEKHQVRGRMIYQQVYELGRKI